MTHSRFNNHRTNRIADWAIRHALVSPARDTGRRDEQQASLTLYSTSRRHVHAMPADDCDATQSQRRYAPDATPAPASGASLSRFICDLLIDSAPRRVR